MCATQNLIKNKTLQAHLRAIDPCYQRRQQDENTKIRNDRYDFFPKHE